MNANYILIQKQCPNCGADIIYEGATHTLYACKSVVDTLPGEIRLTIGAHCRKVDEIPLREA